MLLVLIQTPILLTLQFAKRGCRGLLGSSFSVLEKERERERERHIYSFKRVRIAGETLKPKS